MAPKERVNWDETNLQANEEESLAANRMKIDEPKTPFHRLKEDGEEPESFPPKAAAATSSGTIHGDVLAGLDPAALVAAVEAKRDESSTPEDPEEKTRKFNENRKNHYKMDLAALRQQAADLDAEDDEDDTRR